MSDRLLDKNLTALANPAAFFRTALRGKYVQGKKQKVLAKVSVVEKPVPSEQPANTAANKARKAMLKQLDVLSFEDKNALLIRFVESNPSLANYAIKSPNSRLIREALAELMLGLDPLSGAN